MLLPSNRKDRHASSSKLVKVYSLLVVLYRSFQGLSHLRSDLNYLCIIRRRIINLLLSQPSFFEGTSLLPLVRDQNHVDQKRLKLILHWVGVPQLLVMLLDDKEIWDPIQIIVI